MPIDFEKLGKQLKDKRERERMGTTTNMQALWDGTTAPEGGGNRSRIPDGTYVAKIKAWERNDQGQLVVKFYFPKFSGSNAHFDTETSWLDIPGSAEDQYAEPKTKAIKSYVERLNLTGVRGFDSLFTKATVEQAVGAEVEVNKKTTTGNNGKSYSKYYINKRLGGNGKVETPAATVADDDIPF